MTMKRQYMSRLYIVVVAVISLSARTDLAGAGATAQPAPDFQQMANEYLETGFAGKSNEWTATFLVLLAENDLFFDQDTFDTVLGNFAADKVAGGDSESDVKKDLADVVGQVAQNGNGAVKQQLTSVSGFGSTPTTNDDTKSEEDKAWWKAFDEAMAKGLSNDEAIDAADKAVGKVGDDSSNADPNRNKIWNDVYDGTEDLSDEEAGKKADDQVALYDEAVKKAQERGLSLEEAGKDALKSIGMGDAETDTDTPTVTDIVSGPDIPTTDISGDDSESEGKLDEQIEDLEEQIAEQKKLEEKGTGDEKLLDELEWQLGELLDKRNAEQEEDVGPDPDSDTDTDPMESIDQTIDPDVSEEPSIGDADTETDTPPKSSFDGEIKRLEEDIEMERKALGTSFQSPKNLERLEAELAALEAKRDAELAAAKSPADNNSERDTSNATMNEAPGDSPEAYSGDIADVYLDRGIEFNEATGAAGILADAMAKYYNELIDDSQGQGMSPEQARQLAHQMAMELTEVLGPDKRGQVIMIQDVAKNYRDLIERGKSPEEARRLILEMVLARIPRSDQQPNTVSGVLDSITGSGTETSSTTNDDSQEPGNLSEQDRWEAERDYEIWEDLSAMTFEERNAWLAKCSEDERKKWQPAVDHFNAEDAKADTTSTPETPSATSNPGDPPTAKTNDFVGTDTITVTIHDSSAPQPADTTATGMITVDVTPKNDTPMNTFGLDSGSSATGGTHAPAYNLYSGAEDPFVGYAANIMDDMKDNMMNALPLSGGTPAVTPGTGSSGFAMGAAPNRNMQSQFNGLVNPMAVGAVAGGTSTLNVTGNGTFQQLLGGTFFRMAVGDWNVNPNQFTYNGQNLTANGTLEVTAWGPGGAVPDGYFPLDLTGDIINNPSLGYYTVDANGTINGINVVGFNVSVPAN